MIKSMKLSWIATADIQKSKKFFIETLGLEIKNDTAEYGWMELQGHEGGMYLGVGQAQPEHPDEKPGMNAVVTMTVDDIVAAKKTLEAKGVRFIDEIIEVPGHVKMVTFVDPDGNRFQLVQELDIHTDSCC